MKLIIDIPETPLYRDMYTAICENGYIYDEDNENIAKIIKDGTPLEEELKKIKAEIMSIGNWREHYEMPIAYLSCLTIVEHHISELKGEQK